jgi:hypothetical protein
MIEDQNIGYNQFRSLQQMLDSLVYQLREVQLEIQHKKEPFWKNMAPNRLESEFMSAECNKRVRPNVRLLAEPGSGRQ